MVIQPVLQGVEIMTNTEIKKALYKQKPTAQLEQIKGGIAHYYTQIIEGDFIRFEVPCNDMGTASFYTEMDAKLLNRWIVNDL